MDEPVEQTEQAGGRPRWMTIVTVVAAVVGVVTLVLGVSGFSAASSADDEAAGFEAETSDLEGRLDDLVEQYTALDEQTDDVDSRTNAVIDTIGAQLAAGDGSVEAGNDIVSVFQRAVELGNAGDLAGERAVFETEGAEAIADAEEVLEIHRTAQAGYADLISALGEVVP